VVANRSIRITGAKRRPGTLTAQGCEPRASAIGVGEVDEFFSIGTWVIAILGALLLLAIYRVVIDRRSGTRRT
jgi:hypothetical protein